MRNTHRSQELPIAWFRSKRRKLGHHIDSGKNIEPLLIRLTEIIQCQFAIAESKLDEC